MKRIALLGTGYTYLSRTQQIADRFLVGYPWDGEWHRPEMKIVSACIGQQVEGDLSGARALEFGFTLYPSVAEALRCGQAALAVDAVLLIDGGRAGAAHDFFRQAAEVFEKDGRAVPVFLDGQLADSFEQAASMVETARRLRFPLLAGSTLPLTWRLPDLELPLGCEIAEALMVGVHGRDTGEFDALETLQSMVERRRGGESGVRSVQHIEGEAVWKAGAEGRWSRTLLSSALSRSDTPLGLAVKDSRTQDLVASGALPDLVEHPEAILIEHNDGLHTALLMLDGAVKDCNFAARGKALGLRSCQFLPAPPPNVSSSARLAANIEELFATGRSPYPVERTLLAGGVLESALLSRSQGGRRIATPHLKVSYRAPR